MEWHDRTRVTKWKNNKRHGDNKPFRFGNYSWGACITIESNRSMQKPGSSKFELKVETNIHILGGCSIKDRSVTALHL